MNALESFTYSMFIALVIGWKSRSSLLITCEAPQAVKGKVQEGERLLPPAAQAF
jgi:hypothetical protein